MGKRIALLLAILCLLPTFCVGAESDGIWDGNRYTNQVSGVHFTLPENWVKNPEGALPNSFFDVIVSDQTGENAIAIGLIDLSALVQMMSPGAIGPYAGLLDQIDSIDEEAILGFLTSMVTSGQFGEKSEAKMVSVGDSEYLMISILQEDESLMQSILIRSAGKWTSFILFSSSDQTESEWFLAHFS